MLDPKAPRARAAPAGTAVMDQFGLQFTPDFLIAKAGQTVEFRSSEDVLHNVRVDEVETKAPVFNVATPPFGSYQHAFERPGYYQVSCDVHPAMRANIFVASTPYAGLADASGTFSIAEVEAGAYTVRTFPSSAYAERTVEIAAPRTELALVAR